MEKQKWVEGIEFVRKITVNGLYQNVTQDNKVVVCIVATVIIEEKDSPKQSNGVRITPSGINQIKQHSNQLTHLKIIISH